MIKHLDQEDFVTETRRITDRMSSSEAHRLSDDALRTIYQYKIQSEVTSGKESQFDPMSVWWQFEEFESYEAAMQAMMTPRVYYDFMHNVDEENVRATAHQFFKCRDITVLPIKVDNDIAGVVIDHNSYVGPLIPATAKEQKEVAEPGGE